MHDLPLITTIAAAFTAAWIFGLITQSIGLSPIVGYLLAGIIIGPHTPGFTGDVGIAQQLAEVGVILLMFGVGLHFHVKDLLAVKGVAIPGAVGQSLVATLLGMAVFWAFGMPLNTGAVIGMAMAVASTVVLMRVLMDADVLDSSQGHVAVGWLLVEDIFTVVILVLIPVLAAQSGAEEAAKAAGPWWAGLGLALLKLAALVVIVMVGGSRLVPWVLVQVARVRSRELFTLTVLVLSVAIAAGAYVFFGASMALGAFLAGMVVAQSPVSHQAAADALPLRDAFAVLFFVSVGMLFDPGFVLEEPLMILAALGIILIAKPLTALVIVAMLGHSARTALTVAVGLAQIGEFSFILSEVARKHGVMSDEGHNIIVASAIISITINPLLFRSLGSMEAWAQSRPRLWRLMNGRAEQRVMLANAAAAKAIGDHAPQPAAGAPDRRLAIVVGYGPVGQSVDQLLRDAGIPTVIVDLNMDTISALTARGRDAIFGDSSHESVLENAGIARASHLILTIAQSGDRAATVMTARNLNPNARILVRARYLREREELEQAGASAAVFEEAEAAVALARLVLTDTGATREVVERKVRDLRLRLILENVSNLGTQTVRGVMVPWTRVHHLTTTDRIEDVRRQVVEHRYSRWPVVDAATGRPVGYLLAKDLVTELRTTDDWTPLIRPLLTVSPDDDIESTLSRLQREGASLSIVEEQGRPVGIITIEDILEQVVGRMEDEYPHSAEVPLSEALARGGIVMNLTSRSAENAIRELAAAIPPGRLSTGVDAAMLAIDREREVSTNVGMGVAIPHARCPGLREPLVIFGRASEGFTFGPRSAQPVRLVFLLVTPADRPDVQIHLLSRVAAVAGKKEVREALLAAPTREAVIEIIQKAEAAPRSGS